VRLRVIAPGEACPQGPEATLESCAPAALPPALPPVLP